MMILAHVVFLGLANSWYVMNPAPLMVWLGLGYSLGAASIWPTVGCIVESKVLGTAYGCMTAVQNLGLAVFPMVIGFLQDAPAISGTSLQYTLPILIFIGCEAVSLALTVMLIGIDKKRHSGVMNASAEVKALLKKEAVPAEVIIESPSDITWKASKSSRSKKDDAQNETPPKSTIYRDSSLNLSQSPFLGTKLTKSIQDES